MSRQRTWYVTVKHSTEHDWQESLTEAYNSSIIARVEFVKEESSEGYLHWHGIVTFHNPCKFERVQKLCGTDSHLEVPRENLRAWRIYIRKGALEYFVLGKWNDDLTTSVDEVVLPIENIKKTKKETVDALVRRAKDQAVSVEEFWSIIEETRPAMALNKRVSWSPWIKEHMRQKRMERIVIQEAGRVLLSRDTEEFNSERSRALLLEIGVANDRNIPLWIVSPTGYGKTSWIKSHMTDYMRLNSFLQLEQLDDARVLWFDDFDWDSVPINTAKLLLDNVSEEKHFKVRYGHVNIEEHFIRMMIVTDQHTPDYYWDKADYLDKAAVLRRVHIYHLKEKLFDN